ncbi:MAG: penicillin-binding protein activator, partial [Pseudomonadota bacterium]
LVEGLSRALVVSQGSDWGARVGTRFIDTFELGGGMVLDRLDYDDQAFDHTQDLSRLLELDRSEQRITTLSSALGAELVAEPQRRTDVDLIFLAAPDGDARQLMPQLRFLDATDLAVFSTSHAYTGPASGSDLEGLQFPVSPWLLTGSEAHAQRERILQQYPALSSPNLSQLHALGRDALALMPWLDAMKQDRQLYLAGNIGRLRLADGTTFERDLPWARVDQQRIVAD